MVFGSTAPVRATVGFEPSTWAEVEDAATSRKAAAGPHDPVVAKIVSYTNCSIRCFSGDVPVESYRPRLPDSRQLDDSSRSAQNQKKLTGWKIDKSDNQAHNLHRNKSQAPLARGKRNPTLIGDILGLGRVDLETQTLLKKVPTDFSFSKPNVQFSEIEEKDIIDSVAPTLNPSSTSFQPVHYLARLHEKTSFAEFKDSLKNLSYISEVLSEQTSSLRGTAFPSLALAAAAVEQTRRSAASNDSFSDLLESMEDRNQLAKTEAALNETYRHIVDRQNRIDRLKRALIIVNRFSWLFELPSSLRVAGKADVVIVEQNALLYARAKDWLHAQDGRSSSSKAKDWIERETETALLDFVNDIEQRISVCSSSDKPHLPRLMHVLESVGHESAVAAALNTRMSFAHENLRKASRIGAVSSVLRARIGGGSQSDALELVARMSRAFLDGMEQFWDLAQFANSNSKWSDIISLLLPSLVSEYAEQIRGIILEDTQMVSRESALAVVQAYSRAIKEVRVPSAYLGPLRDVVEEIVDAHVSTLCRAVKASTSDIARSCFESDTVGSSLPSLAFALVEHAVAEVRDLIEPHTGILESGLGESGEHNSGSSNAMQLATACVRVPELVVDAMRGFIMERSREASLIKSSLNVNLPDAPSAQRSIGADLNRISASLHAHYNPSIVIGTARCCSCFVDGGIVQDICHMVKEQLYVDGLDKIQAVVVSRLRSVRQDVIQIYCDEQFPELSRSARRIAQMRNFEGVRGAQSMDIIAASPQAIEVLLNLCIAIARAREDGASAVEIDLVQRELLGQIARALDEVLTSIDGGPDMAAQIWVDVTVITTLVGELRGPYHSARRSTEGLLAARQAAVDAIKRTGFPFGTAEEETLRRIAVIPSVEKARLLRQAVDGHGPGSSVPKAAWVHDAMIQTSSE